MLPKVTRRIDRITECFGIKFGIFGKDQITNYPRGREVKRSMRLKNPFCLGKYRIFHSIPCIEVKTNSPIPSHHPIYAKMHRCVDRVTKCVKA